MKNSTYAPVRGENLVGRVLLGAVALAAAAGETGLNIQAASAGGWDALAVCQVSAPWLALATVLGVEHSHEGLGIVRRAGMWVAVTLIVGVVMMGSMHRTAASQDADMQAGDQAEKHAVQLRHQRDVKLADAARLTGLADVEATKGGCKTICKGWRSSAAEATTAAAALETEASHLGLTKDGLALAHEARTLHVDIETYVLYKPLALPLALQWLALLCGSVAFAPARQRPVVAVAAPIAAPVADRDAELAKVSKYIVELLQAGGKIGSVSELAELAGVDVSNASRAATALQKAGRVVKHRDGQRVALRLVA